MDRRPIDPPIPDRVAGPPGGVVRALWAELHGRQPTLAWFALSMLVAMVPALLALAIDERTIRDVSVWSKPLKFMASTALFAATTAWFMGLLPPAVRRSRCNRAVVGTLVATSLFEVGYITLQAALGQASHYHMGDRLHAALFVGMAVAAVGLTATQAVLAWQIAVHGPGRPHSVSTLSVIASLALTFVLATASGFMLGGRQPPPGAGLPLVGWHLGGPDARPAHFLGVHAQQAIPLAGWWLQRWAPVPARLGLAMVTAGYGAAWLALALPAAAAPGTVSAPLLPLPGLSPPAPGSAQPIPSAASA